MQFIPILKPVLERGVDEIIYDDIRETCETALATLKQVMGAAAEKEEISVSFKQMQERSIEDSSEHQSESYPARW